MICALKKSLQSGRIFGKLVGNRRLNTMLGKPFVYKALFPVIALALSIVYAPMGLLHRAAPGWEQLTQAHEFVGILTKGAWREPAHARPG
jgi:hypothetical protein